MGERLFLVFFVLKGAICRALVWIHMCLLTLFVVGSRSRPSFLASEF